MPPGGRLGEAPGLSFGKHWLQFKYIKQKSNVVSITTKCHKLFSKKIKIQLILRLT